MLTRVAFGIAHLLFLGGKAGQATALHAAPRASVNGIPMEQVYYDWAERTFGELLHEVDASLPAKH